MQQTPSSTDEQQTGYFAAEGFTSELIAELRDVREVHDRLVLAAGEPQPAAWAQNVWLAPQRIAIASIGDAARTLRTMQRNWALYSFAHHRRAALIEAKLPPFRPKPLAFPSPPPSAPIGCWTLLEPGLMLAAARSTSPFRHGEAQFVEDRVAPPNRAYLKLWEALTLIGQRPQARERCIDLGASPGGWSWALAQFGAEVTAVDKAPLAPEMMRDRRITFLKQSAFAVDPLKIERFDWMFCDVACYPRRLLDLVKRWIAAAAARHIVATIKFQGPTDLEIQREFERIPKASLRHLFHNKHELTFSWHSG